MTDPVDFQAEYDKRHGPDSEHVFVDGLGKKWFEFCCEFDDGSKTYGFRIWALDFADAERRLNLLKENARVNGQLYTIVPG